MLCVSCSFEDRVGEWDFCYECQSEAFAICLRCYRKQYDSHSISCYFDFATCNIFCEELDFRVSEGVVANKHDTRYTIGYEVEPGKVAASLRELPGTTRVLRQ